VKGRLFLDVIVRQSTPIFQLLAGKDKSLLIGGNTFLILDLGLNVLNCVGWLNIEGNGLSCEGLDEDLHTTSQSEHQVKSGLLLNVIVRKGSAVLKLLSGENESLLIGGDSLLVLDLGLDILNSV
jgi:hypothetical protein